MRIALGIEYAGCNYYGWQTQSITPTIQETIELALSEVANEKVIIHCGMKMIRCIQVCAVMGH